MDVENADLRNLDYNLLSADQLVTTISPQDHVATRNLEGEAPLHHMLGTQMPILHDFIYDSTELKDCTVGKATRSRRHLQNQNMTLAFAVQAWLLLLSHLLTLTHTSLCLGSHNTSACTQANNESASPVFGCVSTAQSCLSHEQLCL